MDYALPIAYALLLWWFSTGLIFYLDQLPVKTFKWSMVGGTMVLAGALWVVWAERDDTSLFAVYSSFTAGVLAWGWQELSLYTGFVTGPRKQSCQAGCSGWRHFGHALGVNLWHEIAIVAVAVAIWGACGPISCCGPCTCRPGSTCSLACATSRRSSCPPTWRC